MSQTHIITAEVIELNNPKGSEPVTIRHRNNRHTDEIIFDEKVKFNYQVENTELKIGTYIIKVDGNDDLVIQKNGTTIFTFSE